MSSSASTSLNLGFLNQFKVQPTLSESVSPWQGFRGCGVAPLLFDACKLAQLDFAALVMPCAEGNNVPDAAALTIHLLQMAGIPRKASTPAIQLALPPSWSQLFGHGPDPALFV